MTKANETLGTEDIESGNDGTWEQTEFHDDA